MQSILKHIAIARQNSKKLLAILVDPDKIEMPPEPAFLKKLDDSSADMIFIGGSDVSPGRTAKLVKILKKEVVKPLVIFPGNAEQITDEADALLFLMLISGRNPDYLIGEQLKAARVLKSSDLEVIPTSYILIGDDNNSSVERVSGTRPLPRKAVELITDTAYAGELLGHKLIYLEAGSGAEFPVPPEVIHAVSEMTDLPLIVGGGIRSKKGIATAFNAGADLVVIGTAFEADNLFFDEL